MNHYLDQMLRATLNQLYPGVKLPDTLIEKPRDPEHGDAASTIALSLARQLKKAPRQIADEITGRLNFSAGHLQAVEIAGPGFINFRFSEKWFHDKLLEAWKSGSSFGKSEHLKGKKILVEFVSANPTGPLTVGHGRNAVLGDTLSRLLEWTGAQVEREYYFNNAGRQMRLLGESVKARYLQAAGKPADFPQDGYEGAYITDIAESLFQKFGGSLDETSGLDVFREAAETLIFEDIQRTLERLHIRMDHFFNEHSLYEDGSIQQVVETLREKNLAYDKDGATWFKTTAFGKEKDTVLIKSSGEPTYRLPDMAYHINKLRRSFDLAIDIFGADHIATYPDVIAGTEACGEDSKKIEVIVYQFVSIVKEGKPFKMSTRKANFVTLDELMDEVGADVTRFFFLMRAPGTHLEFDIDEARQAGEKNPVYYLQYAHARICSIRRKVSQTYAFEDRQPDFGLLDHPSEINLTKRILEFPLTVRQAAKLREPHRLIHYLNDLATSFHRFYHDCRILGEDEDLAIARMELLAVTACVLAGGLEILGISAPEKM